MTFQRILKFVACFRRKLPSGYWGTLSGNLLGNFQRILDRLPGAVVAVFVLKFANFRCHGNRGQSEQFLTVTFKQADPQNPHWVQVYGSHLLFKASYSQFCVKMRDFS